jgi:2-polyprenyl-3-methyl-5-hydroxy-6-metoxy-1,4-benzoquinol methylase
LHKKWGVEKMCEVSVEHCSDVCGTKVFKCPICYGKSKQVNSLFLLEMIKSETYCCLECGTCFRQPLPGKEELHRYYQSRYFRYSDDIERSLAETQGKWILDMMTRANIDLSPLRYLEFGAGRGWLVSFMKGRKVFNSAVGYEPDNKSVQWGRNKLNVDLQQKFLSDFLEDKGRQNENKVFISLVHVLEHLHHPEDALRSLKSSFQDSYIFIEVPDAEKEGQAMMLDTFSASSMGQHLWSFTERGLRILMEKSGFKVIAFSKDGEPKFWSNHVRRLKLWQEFSEYYENWQQNGFELKRGSLIFLKMMCKCLTQGLIVFWQRLLFRSYSRLDLPVIRIIAEALPE